MEFPCGPAPGSQWATLRGAPPTGQPVHYQLCGLCQVGAFLIELASLSASEAEEEQPFRAELEEVLLQLARGVSAILARGEDGHFNPTP